MSKLKLGLDSQKVFGEFLPSVFINKVVVSYGDISPTDTFTGKDLKIDATLEVSFSRDPEQVRSTDHFVDFGLANTYLYAVLSPYSSLNTALEQSQLSLKDLIATLQAPPADAETITSSWQGFTYIINMLKDAFINDWFDDSYAQGETDGIAWSDTDRSAGIVDLTSEIAEKFWGTVGDYDEPNKINVDGPWTSGATGGFVDRWLERQLEFTSATTGDSSNIRVVRILLRNLMAGTSNAIVDESSFDKDGNEVTRITNITTNFTYSSDFFSAIGEGMPTPALEHVDKLFLICFVGSDATAEGLYSLKPNLFNANFGDISYEHILQNNSVPAREENIFVEIVTEEVFNGTPIQTINKKYYTPTPINQTQVISSLNTLATNFTKWSEKDKRLKEYLQNLLTLLKTKATAPDLLPELALYAASYPNKDLGSPTGKFYNAFTQIVGSYNRSVAQQPQLAKKLIYNDRILDLRPAPQKNSYYATIPDPCNYFSKDGDDFIPYIWSNMSRYAEQTIPRVGLLSDFVEFAVGERYNRSYSNPLETQTQEEWLDWIRSMAMNDWEALDESWMYEEANQQSRTWTDTVVANKGMWYFDWTKALHTQSNLSSVINIRKLQELFHWTIPYEYYPVSSATMEREEQDFELQNNYNASQEDWWPMNNSVAETITLRCGMIDPAFAGVTPNPLPDWLTTAGWPKYPIQMESQYKYDSSNLKWGQPFVYTAEKFAGYGVGTSDQTLTGGEITGEMFNDPGSYDMFLPDAMHYSTDTSQSTPGPSVPEQSEVTPSVYEMITWVDESNQETLSHRSNSYLLFQNFDVMNPDFYSRLEGYGSYDLNLNEDNFYGRGPRDGYRILSFEYRDYMDDDVAYYNTFGTFMGDRDRPAPLMDHRDPWTNYQLTVHTIDRSLAFIPVFYDYLNSVYSEFEDYESRANQICSFNNIYGRFNDFFLEGIEELYGTSVKPWIRAAYVFNALRDLLYASFSQKHDGWVNYEDLLEDCRHIVNDIGPANGSLAGIAAFKSRFARILGVINPATPGARDGSGFLLERATAVLEECPLYMADGSGVQSGEAWLAISTLWEPHAYTNKWRIDKMIYGNIALGAYWDDAYPDFVPPNCIDRGLDESVYPYINDRIRNWLACLTAEFKGNLKNWALANANASDGFGTTEGSTVDSAASNLDPRAEYEWTNSSDEDIFYHLLDGIGASGSTSMQANPGESESLMRAKGAEGVSITNNRYRAWRYAIMASAFLHRWGDELEDWSQTTGHTTTSLDSYASLGSLRNQDAGAFWSVQHMRAALDSLGLGQISPYTGFEPPTDSQIASAAYYNETGWASNYGGRSWSEIIAIGCKYLSQWGCNSESLDPFRQEIPVHATGDGVGYYITGTDLETGETYDSRYDFSTDAGYSGAFEAYERHFEGGTYTDLWDLLNSRTYQFIYERITGVHAGEVYVTEGGTLMDPGPDGIQGAARGAVDTGRVDDWDLSGTYEGQEWGVHLHAVDDYDFFCTGYVMWGWEYEDWYRGVGDWDWSEGELVEEAETYDFNQFGFVVAAAAGGAGPAAISSMENCFWLETGPSQGGYYDEALGYFKCDGSVCRP